MEFMFLCRVLHESRAELSQWWAGSRCLKLIFEDSNVNLMTIRGVYAVWPQDCRTCGWGDMSMLSSMSHKIFFFPVENPTYGMFFFVENIVVYILMYTSDSVFLTQLSI